jgi:hypothetical protein
MEQHALKNVNNCLNTNISSNLETSGGQISILYLDVVIFSTPVMFRYLWQLKTVVFLHWCLIRALLLWAQTDILNTTLKNVLAWLIRGNKI